ncbi:MAG: hypothetical protein LBJ41_07530 [Treponema sp.]|jgi:hypothetical protein|nr:hypothetical protein [Treponema sp.]
MFAPKSQTELVLCPALWSIAVAIFASGSHIASGPADAKTSGAFDRKRFNGQAITGYMTEYPHSGIPAARQHAAP